MRLIVLVLGFLALEFLKQYTGIDIIPDSEGSSNWIKFVMAYAVLLDLIKD